MSDPLVEKYLAEEARRKAPVPPPPPKSAEQLEQEAQVAEIERIAADMQEYRQTDLGLEGYFVDAATTIGEIP